MDRINWINCGLMIVALVAAMIAPFHVFLFAYAILGPLHYLTEISWLHDRQYFAPRAPLRRMWLVIVVAAAAAVGFGYVSNDLLARPVAPTFEIGLVYLALVGAALAVFVKRTANGVALAIVGALLIVPAAQHPFYAIVAYLLITIIHVLFFTASFVLFGALKSRSRSGLISLGVFIVCAIVPFVIQTPAIAPSQSVRSIYASFEQLNDVLLSIFTNASAIAVMRLIAFAYTYHYLNWFSKTSIIKWHEVPRKRAIGIIGAWIGGVALYAFNYRIGFAVFYLLSIVHVMLEFPLNHQTLMGIARCLRPAGAEGRLAIATLSSTRGLAHKRNA
ncbi:MAG TPA: hypothetical protein VMU84_10825 [Thermoanaerobaculia bacterium]|nr:hypothetical protein [Thermoanaerobaculia bacterium]